MISNKHLIMLVVTIFIIAGAGISLIFQKPAKLEPTPQEISSTDEPYLREVIEDYILALSDNGLKFSTMDYAQWDPMENGLWHCKNTFKDKVTNTKHSYLGRVTVSDEGIVKMYYLKIDDDTIIWLEEQETEYIDNN